MPYKDPVQQRAYLAEHYRKNKEKYYRSSKKAKNRKRVAIRKLKEKPCADCGLVYPYYVMQFDHIDNKMKVDSVSQLLTNKSIQKVLEEIKKCEIVCANCHAVRTFLRQMGRYE